MPRNTTSGGPRIPSLELLRDEARFEQEAQIRHFEALESKAGILLGFAGALVAIAPAGRRPYIDVARFAAALSALVALSAFWPRRLWLTNLRELRDALLRSDPAFTNLRLLDTQISRMDALRADLQGKARRLRISMSSLAFAAVMTSVAIAIH